VDLELLRAVVAIHLDRHAAYVVTAWFAKDDQGDGA
jgi:hypothetical protein